MFRKEKSSVDLVLKRRGTQGCWDVAVKKNLWFGKKRNAAELLNVLFVFYFMV